MFKLKQNQKGLAAIEMTLILPILLLLFFATAEFSRLLYQYNALNKAVRDVSRYIIANPEFTSTNEVIVTEQKKAAAKYLLVYGDFNSSSEILPNLAATTLDINVNDEFITVTVSYPWQPIFSSTLPSFVSDTSFDLSFPLVTSYTMRAL